MLNLSLAMDDQDAVRQDGNHELREARLTRMEGSTMWRPIDENTPRDGSLVLCCWKGSDEPCLLRWKTNDRIVRAKARGQSNDDLVDSYFGDPDEWDDYDLAKPANAPTHWHPYDKIPA
jgi:hypothetical protein